MTDNCICSQIAQHAANILSALTSQATGSQACTNSQCFESEIELFNGTGAQTAVTAQANSGAQTNMLMFVFMMFIALLLHLTLSAKKRKRQEEQNEKLNDNHNWRNDSDSGLAQ